MINHAAIEVHYRENFDKRVRQLSGKLGYHEAQDLVQDVYVKLLEQDVVIENVGHSFEMILRQLRINNLKAKVFEEETVEDDSIFQVELDPLGSPEELLLNKEHVRMVEALIRDKKKEHASVLTLVFLRQLEYDEVAGRTGTSYDNVEKIVNRFRQELIDRGVFA